MQQVFNNDMTFHVWAQNSQEYGRNFKDSIHFENEKLFSYEQEIARIFPEINTAFFNADKYTVTTAKHVQKAFDAWPGKAYWIVDYDFLIEIIETKDKRKAKEYFVANFKTISELANFTICNLIGMKSNLTLIRQLNEKRLAEKERIKHKKLLRNAQKWNKVNAKRLTSHINFYLKNYKYLHSSTYLLHQNQLEIFHAMKAAKKAGWNRVAAKLKNQRKALNDTIKECNVKSQQAEIRKRIRFIIKYMRDENLTPFIYESNSQAIETTLTNRYTFQHNSIQHNLNLSLPCLLKSNYATRDLKRQLETLLEIVNRVFDKKKTELHQEHLAKDKKNFELWLTGKSSYCPAIWRITDNKSCRMRIKDNRLETSLGASVSLDDAIRIFKMVRFCKKTGKSYKANDANLHAGHFRIDSISSNGDMKTRCHRFSYNQMYEVAKRHGLLDMAKPEDIT